MYLLPMINPATDKLIELKDIARRIGKRYVTVLGWHTVAGELDAVCLGGTWYTTEAAFTEYGYRKDVGQQAGDSSISSGRDTKQSRAEYRRKQNWKLRQLES